MIQCKFVKSLPVSNGLGECILWNQANEKLYWTDMPNDQLLIYSPKKEKTERIPTPENLCSFGFIEGSDWLICGFESGIASFHPDTLEIIWHYKLPNAQYVRMNDGRVDSSGNFWVGSLIDNDSDFNVSPANSGKLFRFDSTGKVSEHLSGIHISNSLCWSTDNKYMYFADSPRNEIYRFDYDDQTASIGQKELFAKTAKGIHPDGSVVDSEGYLWNAQWGNGEVIRYAPSGEIDFVLQLPAKQVTCLTFGGEKLTDLYITTANYGLSEEELREQPLAGNVFIYETSVTGQAENLFINTFDR